MSNPTLEEILKMDVKSDEFFKIYQKISDKYWTFENPDDFQMAAKTLVMWAERYDSDKIILCHKIIEQIMNMDKGKAAKGHLVFNDCEYYFDIYENENSKDSMENILMKAGKAMENGGISIKDKMGKKFF